MSHGETFTPGGPARGRERDARTNLLPEGGAAESYPGGGHDRVAGFCAALVLLASLAAASGGTLRAQAVPAPDAAEDPVELAALVVTATRAPERPERLASAVTVFAREALEASPSLALDDTLRALPAFSLFRRSNSLMAHPTAQGVSLRGIGPSGASRSLVLLDGVPLNDPFGGWVAWSRVPNLALARAEVVRGGGSGAWGNAALGGTVQLLSEPAGRSRHLLRGELGDHGLRRGEVVATLEPGATTAIRLGGRWMEFAGFHQFPAGLRGPIDRTLDARHRLGHGQVEHRLAGGLALTGAFSVFAEDRGNGTPFQRNHSRDLQGRFALRGELSPTWGMEILAYGGSSSFASGFSTVDASRTAETPALDQYEVPATAGGASIVLTGSGRAQSVTTLGADVRFVRGETREDFLFAAGGFQRRRHAGGRQSFAGVFAARTQALAPRLHGNAALRLDYWRGHDGRRREWLRASGAIVRDEHFGDRSGVELNPSLGAVWQAAETWRVRGSLYRAFRVPTLNELYRPFRVGNVSTEANAALDTESLRGGEIGLEGGAGGWSWSVHAFTTSLRDAVGNVTLAAAPGLVQRQRLNLGEVRTRGVESELRWRSPDGRVQLALRHLGADSRVREARSAPALVGLRPAQVPRHTATLQCSWAITPRWRIDAGGRAFTAQFEDDANALRLRGGATADLAVRWSPEAGWEVSVLLENVFDRRIETGRPALDLVSLGPARRAGLGVSAVW